MPLTATQLLSTAYATTQQLSPLLLKAIDAGQTESVKSLLPQTPLSQYQTDDLLSYAVGKGQAPIVELLFSNGGSVDANFLGSLLHVAIVRGREQVVEILLKRGADINTKHHLSDATPLMTAIMANLATAVRIPMVTQLLNHGANPNITSCGVAPLFAAMTAAHLEPAHSEQIVELLLKHGANVNTTNLGMTPLMVAVGLGRPKIVKLLLDHKADIAITLKTPQGRDVTALDMAKVSNKTGCFALLEQAAQKK